MAKRLFILCRFLYYLMKSSPFSAFPPVAVKIDLAPTNIVKCQIYLKLWRLRFPLLKSNRQMCLLKNYDFKEKHNRLFIKKHNIVYQRTYENCVTIII